MNKLTRTQLSVLASYSSPFILLSALVINIWLTNNGLSSTPFKLVFLSASFPIGLAIGRMIYFRRSHVEITFDDESFHVFRGKGEVAQGQWRSYKIVSIVMDRYGRPNLRLYKSFDGDHQDLPISRTNAKPQEFRDHVQQKLLKRRSTAEPNLQVVEAF